MAETPPRITPQPELLGRRLEQTAADLRVLAEEVGAVPPGPARAVSLRGVWSVLLVVVAIAALASWFIWDHWHSLFAAFAPLVWIFAHGWRWRRRVARSEDISA